jgi:MFS transporter, DHA2 family, multidrug resistance protein
MSVERSQPWGARARHPYGTDGLPIPRRYWAIVAILLAIRMPVLDSTIANIALPSIARSFHITQAASVWVTNAYQLAILVALRCETPDASC